MKMILYEDVKPSSTYALKVLKHFLGQLVLVLNMIENLELTLH